MSIIDTLRKYKLFDVVLLDNIATIIFSMWLSKKINKPFPLVLIGIYILSIIIHYIFRVKTNTLIYLNAA